MSTRVFRSLCKKHPELKGERYSSNGNCVGCHAERIRKGRETMPPESKVIGSVCSKHPDLEGLRYAVSRNCVGCNQAGAAARRNRKK